MAQECDVLVVGAGPVGLMLAIMLRNQGIACLVRPDNYIAWCGEQLNEEDLVARFSMNGITSILSG